MERLNEMELDILITIRNNETTEADQFYTLFENRWPRYMECLRILSERRLFILTDFQNRPGLKIFKLTKEGNARISQLLSERSHAIHVKLAHLRHSKNLESSHRAHALFSVFSFFTHFSSRFKRQVH
jgi:hypothetical protein